MIWSLFRRQPASFTDSPRQHLYTVALSESVPDLTDFWRGEHLMRIAATDETDARRKALAKAARVGIVLNETHVIGVRGGDTPA